MKKAFSKKSILLWALLLSTSTIFGQTNKLYGSVLDDNNLALPGATIQVLGTNIAAVTDDNGHYTLPLKRGNYTLKVNYLGFQENRTQVNIDGDAQQNIVLKGGEEIGEVVVVGSRAEPRSRLESLTPVDVIDRKALKEAPQLNLNQLLNQVIPSFQSNTQVISDGTDHIDPASLRGLGPDQVLVLINGKRRHTTSLININGTFGKGSVGTDLNAIPIAAIKRIEILRDGASAQYGSDAIAGVINIVLDDNTSEGRADITTGGYVSKNSENGIDGETVQASANLGYQLGTKGGYVNVSGSFDYRNPTNRQKEFTGTIFKDYNFPALYPTPTGADVTEVELARLGKTRADYVSRIGQAKNRGGALFFNSSLPLNENAEFYAFGGLNYRKGESAAFRRQPAQLNQNSTYLYPDGFLPLINTENSDQSVSAGLRGKKDRWDIDFSNTFGINNIDFVTSNTLNASLLDASPTRFEAGGYRFAQNTTNLDISRHYDFMAGLNLSFGGEHRLENYQIIAGSEDSYRDYGRSIKIGEDVNGNDILIPDINGNIQTLKAPGGANYAGGAQAFPGFRPENQIDASRSSAALYIDTEVSLTPKLLTAGAVRFENYSDFGSTLNWKLAVRYKLASKWNLRGAASTGFRAPSLHQRYFSATSSLFTDGVIISSGTFRNDSRLATLLGIPNLKEEKSINYSAGFTGEAGNFNLTIDGYFIRIDNRIIYTGQFKGSNAPGASTQDQEIYRILNQAGASTARFFANAIDTETKGIDAVLSYNHKTLNGNFRADLSGTVVKTSIVGDVHASQLLAGKESSYLDDASRIYIESAVPRLKGGLSLSYSTPLWSVMLRNVYFGEVNAATNTVADQETYGTKVVTDLVAGYNLSKSLKLSAGANNLLDIYPDKATGSNVGAGYFVYSRTGQQFGFNGRYLFARLSLTL